MFEKALSKIRDRWWGLLVAYALIFILVYEALWRIIEPLNILGDLKLTSLATWQVFYVTVALLLTSHITLLVDLIFRRKVWAPRNIDPQELNRFHREIKPLLKHISTLNAQLSTTDIQKLVKKTISTASKIHFEIEELPVTKCFESSPFEEDDEVNCSICKGKNVGILSTGQCPRCKLCCPTWMGIRESPDNTTK